MAMKHTIDFEPKPYDPDDVVVAQSDMATRISLDDEGYLYLDDVPVTCLSKKAASRFAGLLQDFADS